MSIKRYILHEFKINLPLFIVFSAFAFLYASLSAAAFDFTITNVHYVFYTNDILTSFAIVPLIFALIYPLTIFSYRYSRNSTDFYYQLAIDKRFYKRVKCIFGLAILVIVFTVAYLFGSLILALRFLTTKLENNEVFIDFYFLGLLTSYPFFLLSIICAYFVSFFLSSLGYGNKDKILLFIFGMVFLLFNLSSLFYLIYLLFDLSKSGIALTFTNPFIISLSPITNFVTSSRISASLCTYNTFLSLSNASNMCAFICYFIQLALSFYFSFMPLIKKKKVARMIQSHI